MSITNLDTSSLQGDAAINALIPVMDQNCTVSVSDIPDLVPVLSVLAAARRGAVFTDVQRLRLKESDRVMSVISMITALGGKAESTEKSLTIHPSKLTGGTVNSVCDHRIAMAAAIAATVAGGPVTILGAECVSKSYPTFWEEYQRLGGQYEQHLR